MKFVLFIEGYTEKAVCSFLKRWLDKELGNRVGIQAERFEGQAQLIKDSAQKAKLYLNAPKQDIIAVIALLDLHGASLPYPNSDMTVEERCAWAKRHLESKVAHDKFRQHFAVHEIEAWLLSNTSIFPAEVRHDLVSKSSQPERVNFNEPPAKLLDRLYLSRTKRHYKKIINGKKLFEELDPALARDKCPHLKFLLDEMLQMARDASL